MKLSIVTTMYYSAPYIEEFYKRVSKEAKKITEEYEIIFVDDGSPDKSLKTALEVYEKDNKVKVIELSRNFGHHKAIMTGLAHSKGDYVFLIDVDLEEEPELLNSFWNEFQLHENLDVLYGIQEQRKGNFFERVTGKWFYKIINFFLQEIKIPKNLTTVRLMTQQYIQALIHFKEREINIAGIWALTGFNQKELLVKKHSLSPTTYTLRKKIYQVINTVASFSAKPLLYIFYVGCLILAMSLYFVFYYLYRKIFHNISIDGWTSLMVSIWFLGGLIIFFIGVIGIYLSKIFIETKQRPYTIIKRIYQKF